MANWPCSNPSCSSHGQPHPNCKCPPPMAEGGNAGHYCASDRQHLQACEYYAEGGVTNDFVSDEQFKPDINNDFVSDEQFKPDSPIKSDFIPDEQFKPDNETPQDSNEAKYGTIGQQVGAGIEGAAKGLLGPLATSAESTAHMLGVPNVSPEDIKGRANENPGIHGLAETGALAAGLMTGAGLPGLIGKGAKPLAVLAGRMAPETSIAATELGSKAMQGALEMGGLQTSDEISKAILGKGDPNISASSALANIEGATLLGLGTGGLFNVIGQGAGIGLKAIEQTRLAQGGKKMLMAMGIASKMKELGIPIDQAEEFISKQLGGTLDFKELKPYMNTVKNASKAAGTSIGGTAGEQLGEKIGLRGIGLEAGSYLGYKKLSPIIEKVLDKAVSKGNQYVYPAIVKCLADGNTDGLFQAIDYANNVSKGAKAISSGVENLFKVGGLEAVDYDADLKAREKLSKSVEEGVIPKQIEQEDNQPPDLGYAEGGEVKAKPQEDYFSKSFPEQASILAGAKGRIYNYLNQIRPQKGITTLPYDKHMESEGARRSYNKALDIANKPLSILGHVKDGSITSEQMQHFIQMHPELHRHLSDKIMEKVISNQMEDEKPNYKTRQSISIFLGRPLEASMTPFNIQAAQSAFAPKQPPQQPQQGANKAKRGTAPLSKVSTNYMTKDQHREERQNKT